jgi:hypothetical protein
MNTARLAKHYGALEPWERVALVVAAAARDDLQEVDRLSGAAPRLRFNAPDHLGHLEGIEFVSLLYMVRQLDLTCLYWRISGALESCSADGDDARTRRLCDRLYRVMRGLGYVMTAHAAAWRRLCAELAIDPDALTRGLWGHDTLARALVAAETDACSADEMRAFAKARDPAAEVVTVESSLAGLREVLDWCVGRWG